MSIQIKELNKSYKSIRALSDVTVEFEKGKIYGLLGRNGAGKSTLLKIITNRIFKDSGEVLVDGLPHDSTRAQSKIYLMSEADCYPPTMRIREVFRWTKEFYGGFDMEKAADYCEKFGLKPDKRVKELSTGYTSVFKLITALCTRAEYVLLDEPVLGLDANHRDMFYRVLIEDYTENPRTVVISTHLIEEVASLIQDVIIIKNGVILKAQSCEELLNDCCSVTGRAETVRAFTEGKTVIGEDALGGMVCAYIAGKIDSESIPDGLTVDTLDLQRLFIQLTNS